MALGSGASAGRSRIAAVELLLARACRMATSPSTCVRCERPSSVKARNAGIDPRRTALRISRSFDARSPGSAEAARRSVIHGRRGNRLRRNRKFPHCLTRLSVGQLLLELPDMGMQQKGFPEPLRPAHLHAFGAALAAVVARGIFIG
eukprot:scaffold160048_cov30-Tisochrysis_lutea.AAC.2